MKPVSLESYYFRTYYIIKHYGWRTASPVDSDGESETVIERNDNSGTAGQKKNDE